MRISVPVSFMEGGVTNAGGKCLTPKPDLQMSTSTPGLYCSLVGQTLTQGGENLVKFPSSHVKNLPLACLTEVLLYRNAPNYVHTHFIRYPELASSPGPTQFWVGPGDEATATQKLRWEFDQILSSHVRVWTARLPILWARADPRTRLWPSMSDKKVGVGKSLLSTLSHTK